MREKVLGSGNFSCSECTPNLWRYGCTVCHAEKPSAEFRDPKSKLEKHSIRRCKVCETCISCHRHFADFSNFATNARYCRSCYRASVELKKCQVCGQAKATSAFTDSQLVHESYESRNLFLRCHACHTCKECDVEKDIRSFDGASAVCIQCNAGKKCQICRQAKAASAFPESQMVHELRNFFLRCTSCHVCEICKEYKDIRAFQGVSSECQTCVSNSQVTVRCNICNNSMPKASFPDNQLLQRGRQDRNTFLRCVHCHTCKVCKEQKDIPRTRFYVRVVHA